MSALVNFNSFSADVDKSRHEEPSAEVDVQGSSAVTKVYVEISRHSFVALCSKACIYTYSALGANKKNQHRQS